MKYQRIIKRQNKLPKQDGFFIKIARIFSCCVLVLCISVFGYAQESTLTDLRHQQAKLLQEIEASKSSYKQTQANKKNALQQYLAVKRRVQKRQALLNALEQEVELIDKSIERNTFVIEALNGDAKRLEEEYAQMLRTAYRQKMNNSKWVFLLSSNNLNNVIQRWRYLKQYDDYRQKQAALILETKKSLELKVDQLTTQKTEKEALIKSTNEQKNLLAREFIQKKELLGQLKSSEVQLAKNIEEQQKKDAQLKRAIEDFMKRALAKNERVTGTEDKTKIVKEASEFKAMFGNLPWPVSNGKIVKAFGRHQHPEYVGVFTENNGIDITANPQAEVQAVYTGKVVGKQYIPSHENMVIISHGNYYTVYSNLQSVSVEKGAEVKSGQKIGRLSSRDSRLHFEVWKEKKRLDPAKWIR